MVGLSDGRRRGSGPSRVTGAAGSPRYLPAAPEREKATQDPRRSALDRDRRRSPGSDTGALPHREPWPHAPESGSSNSTRSLTLSAEIVTNNPSKKPRPDRPL